MPYALAEKVYYQCLPEAAVVADFSRKRLFVLNEAGSLLWQQLMSGASPAPADTPSAAFVAQLTELGLLRAPTGEKTGSQRTLEAIDGEPAILYQAAF